jgi:hypothetical protein
MKKIYKVLLTGLIFLASTTLIAQDVPPPPPAAHGVTGNQDGGGAPIGGGLFILLGLGAAYAGKKVYDQCKEKLEE